MNDIVAEIQRLKEELREREDTRTRHTGKIEQLMKEQSSSDPKILKKKLAALQVEKEELEEQYADAMKKYREVSDGKS